MKILNYFSFGTLNHIMDAMISCKDLLAMIIFASPLISICFCNSLSSKLYYRVLRAVYRQITHSGTDERTVKEGRRTHCILVIIINNILIVYLG